ncbi:hypothetical protein [Flexivirga caeni]|uniref:Uncharacterized protein n=1 Tax=Flexivirga caeni TaxID=2294115 RepID=A0A3M9MHV7_9MICO|nr:hypothetical protein [Flexivirga caeni]RNI25139.1 hypothetical protein EFY87_00345 [Flexivirga caeni]
MSDQPMPDSRRVLSREELRAASIGGVFLVDDTEPHIASWSHTEQIEFMVRWLHRELHRERTDPDGTTRRRAAVLEVESYGSPPELWLYLRVEAWIDAREATAVGSDRQDLLPDPGRSLTDEELGTAGFGGFILVREETRHIFSRTADGQLDSAIRRLQQITNKSSAEGSVFTWPSNVEVQAHGDPVQLWLQIPVQ